MSIIAYTGLPGSGKSYSVVEHQILPALKAGRTVVTNVPLREEKITALGLPGAVVQFPVEAVAAEPHRIREFCTAGCVFVLDEVWRLFPQGQQANKVPDEFKSLLAEHRHMVDAQGNSVQIVFVVQDLANIGAFARRLVESTFVTTKLSFIGMSGSYRVDIFHGAQTGATPPVSNRLRMITGRYRKEIFDLYKSHTMAVDSEQSGANEKAMDTRANILKRPAFIIGAVLVPIVLWYSFHTFSKAFHSGFANASKAPESKGAGAPAVSGAVGGSPAPLWGPSSKEPVPATPRVILIERMGDGSGFVAYLATPGRVLLLGPDVCRLVGINAQCFYRGTLYDGFGAVETSEKGEGGAFAIHKPVGRYGRSGLAAAGP